MLDGQKSTPPPRKYPATCEMSYFRFATFLSSGLNVPTFTLPRGVVDTLTIVRDHLTDLQTYGDVLRSFSSNSLIGKIADVLSGWRVEYDSQAPYYGLELVRKFTVMDISKALFQKLINFICTVPALAPKLLTTLGVKIFYLLAALYGVSFVRFLLQLFVRSYYKNLPPHPQNLIPGGNRDEIRNLARDHIELTNTIPTTNIELCEDCHHTLQMCVCVGWLPGEKIATAVAQKYHKTVDIRNQIVRLQRPELHPLFAQFDILEFPWHGSWIGKLNEFFGLQIRVRYAVGNSFYVGDTRPMEERHITCGNTRYYNVSLVGYFINGVLVRDFNFKLTGVLQRDLVVSEDILRALRRGSLNGTFAETLRTKMDFSLSLPIADNYFILHNVNVLEDSFQFACYLQAGAVTSKSWRDFLLC